MKPRIRWIDIFKGLAMIAIIVGHSGSPMKVHDFVYSFHVAAFLFISGYTFNSQKDFFALVIDKTKRLLVPYFAFNFMFFILYVILSHFNVDSFFYGFKATDILPLGQLVFWAPLAGMGWFLWILFETTLCSAIFIKIILKCRISPLYLFLPMITLFVLGVAFSFQVYHPSIYLYPPFDVNLATIPYFLLGFVARQYRVFDRKQLFLYSTPVFLSVLYVLAWKNNADIGFITRDLIHWPYAVPASLAAFCCLYSCSISAETIGWLRRPLAFIGKNTLTTMCLHVLAFKLTSLILYSLGLCPRAFVSSDPSPITEYYWIVLTVSSICMCLAASALIEKSRFLSFLLMGSPFTPLSGLKATRVLTSMVLLLYAGIFIYSGSKGVFDFARLKAMTSGPVQGEYAEEISSLYEMMKQTPQKAGLYGKLGYVYFRRGEFNEAANQYRIVLAIDPRNMAAMSRLALVYSAQRKPEKALGVLLDMNQVEPANPDISFNIACIYARMNQTDKAGDWLKLAIEKGFNKWDLISRDPDLSRIKNKPLKTGLMENH